ncbi:MAG TPA: hypothetical protein VLS46_02370, partial [Gaiellaceae bacterium]|nr:hypothetical protein [Gaiellaceae bacterium]
MATAEPTLGQPVTFLEAQAPSTELADQWRRLTRAATAVALLSSPALVLYFHEYSGWSWPWSILGALGSVIVCRGLVDTLFRRVIPWPSLFGADSEQLRGEDVVARRRAWFWRFWLRMGLFV